EAGGRPAQALQQTGSWSPFFVSCSPRLYIGLLALPRRGQQAPPTVAREHDIGRVEILAIPQLAGDLFVPGIERFAVIGELAAADLGAASEPHLQPPVGIGEALAGGGDDVGLLLAEDRL